MRNDGTELARGSRDTVRCRTITSGERFTRDNKRGRVGAEVLEEVGEAVEESEALDGGGCRCELVVTETEDTEEDGERDETHELDGLAAPGVNEEEGCPVAGDETGDDDDEVTDGGVPEVLVDGSGTSKGLVGSTETDGVEDDGVVKTETVESNLGNVKISSRDNFKQDSYSHRGRTNCKRHRRGA